MRLIMENVPLLLSKTINSKSGGPVVLGKNHVLLDKNLDRRTIDYMGLDRMMCNPGEVNRTLQVRTFY